MSQDEEALRATPTTPFSFNSQIYRQINPTSLISFPPHDNLSLLLPLLYTLLHTNRYLDAFFIYSFVTSD